MQVGELKSTLTEIDKPAQLRLTLTTGNYHNYYNLWVYPDRTPESEADIFICQSLDDEARKRLSQGGKILLIPDHKAIEEQSVGGLFTPDYWNYAMFKSISENAGREVSPGTLSLLMDEKHPLFRQFPTECHSNWQWWNLVKRSKVLVVDSLPPVEPIVESIDNFTNNRKLVSVFETKCGKGKLIMSAMDILSEGSDKPEIQQMLYSLVTYMNSESFAPRTMLGEEDIRSLILKNEGKVIETKATSIYRGLD